MRAAAHVDALSNIFQGLAHPVTAGVVTAAKLGITAEIIKQYSKKLSGNHAYQAWFAAAQSANRLPFIAASDAPQKIRNLTKPSSDYGVASYLSGGNLFIAPTSNADIDLAALSAVGISSHCVTAPMTGNFEGDNPVFTVSLMAGGQVDFNILDRYIVVEERIVIYDKYINEPGMELIEHIAKILGNGSTLQVFTTKLGSKCIRPSDIAKRLAKVNPLVLSSCVEVSKKFRSLAHDRYLFCGSRLQMVFTAGIDSFGPKNTLGKRVNRQSKISIYAVGNTDPIVIEAGNGTLCTVNGVTADLA